MLRSYEYTEQSYSGVQLQSNLLRDKEINLAQRISSQLDAGCKPVEKCPVCGSSEGEFFYTKWQVDYLMCKECGTVYASCTDDVVEKYKMASELLEFRRSEVYQKEVAERRQQYWEDFLEWMQIRAFRFLKRNKDLSIIDVGNRYYGYIDVIRESELCGKYKLIDSILDFHQNDEIEQADILFYFDQMQQELDPVNRMKQLSAMLKPGGLLVLGTRAGSGFDILTLKENNVKIYPYEHVVLPSVQGLMDMFPKAGYKILEITTPGIMDIKYVKEGQRWLDNSNAFIKNLINAEDSVLQEFQRFLQKNSMSSFVRLIATKEKDHA